MKFREHLARACLKASAALAQRAFKLTQDQPELIPAEESDAPGDIIPAVVITPRARSMLATRPDPPASKAPPEPLVGSVKHRLKKR